LLRHQRKISGGTHSDRGGDCRHASLGLIHTCANIGVLFWDYLGERIGVVANAAITPRPISSAAAARRTETAYPALCLCYILFRSYTAPSQPV